MISISTTLAAGCGENESLEWKALRAFGLAGAMRRVHALACSRRLRLLLNFALSRRKELIMEAVGIHCVAPSRVAVRESFDIKIKVLGPIHEITCSGNWNDHKPALHGPLNRNVQRQIQYHDNCLPEWCGELVVDAGTALSGPKKLPFDGIHQGVFPGDSRPIRVFRGFSFEEPGFHFMRLVDKDSGVEGWSNPIFATNETPATRIFWGDPHWQTFFSDGIRCPEELYAFARDEGFLDFGAISDHMEAVTDRQWDYFQAVTNDYNEPGRFVTLIGQEWTNHNPDVGAPGHRNIYYRGDGGPALRSNSPDCDTLEKLWSKLDSFSNIESLAIPHHSANVVMGVDWEQGWNPKYEKAVEIHSVWENSERHMDDGNIMAIQALQGEMRGRHVVDALRRGYRFGFVGGGDIHDGRPGDELNNESFPPRPFRTWPAGYTAVLVPSLTREAVFDAIRDRRTYATTQSRIYLDVTFNKATSGYTLDIAASSEEGIREAAILVNGSDAQKFQPDGDKRIISRGGLSVPIEPDGFCYVRITTEKGNMAWSSPCWA